MNFRKKPVVIQAVQLTKDNIFEGMTFLGKVGKLSNNIDLDKFEDYKNIVTLNGGLMIDTLEGTMKANFGDYIIKGVQGEYYPCKPDIFQATYEQVTDENNPLAEENSNTSEIIKTMRQVLNIQGYDGNWNYDEYMYGMYNGMEFMMSIAEDREPAYRKKPDEWIVNKKEEHTKGMETIERKDIG